jgi:hypothetical protein
VSRPHSHPPCSAIAPHAGWGARLQRGAVECCSRQGSEAGARRFGAPSLTRGTPDPPILNPKGQFPKCRRPSDPEESGATGSSGTIQRAGLPRGALIVAADRNSGGRAFPKPLGSGWMDVCGVAQLACAPSPSIPFAMLNGQPEAGAGTAPLTGWGDQPERRKASSQRRSSRHRKTEDRPASRIDVRSRSVRLC